MTTAIRIAMIGQRGVPATFGGIERHVEEIGSRLADMGHEVIVYCRPNYSAPEQVSHRGMTLCSVRTAPTKHLEAIVHSAAATVHAARERVDIMHYHALGPGLVSVAPRATSRARIVQTVHGLDQERAKWGRVASGVLGLGGWLSARVPDATVVVSRALQQYYLARYGRPTAYICNGVDKLAAQLPPTEVLTELGLEPGRYVLYVGRLVPEKAPDTLVRAFAELADPDLRLVIAGGSSHTDRYVERLAGLAARDPRVLMPGGVHNDRLHGLYANAAAFVLPSAVEGMPLTLLEAAAHGIPLLASDIAPHREMLGASRPGGRYFRQGDPQDLARALRRILADGPAERAGSYDAVPDVHERYNWDRAAEELAALYGEVLGRRG